LPPRTYGQDDLPIPGWLGGAKNHPKFVPDQMSRYFGMVKCIDDNIGRLLRTLEESDRLDSTIILMTSDHGDLCYEHDRLNKGNPYEGSARVPMLVRYPSLLDAGTVYEDPIGTVDVTPTLLGLAGIQADADFQGHDFTSRLRGEKKPSELEITFLRNAGTKAQWIAAIDARYKLVLSVNDRPWLFDLQTDPDELLNFYGRPGTEAVTRRLAAALKKYAEKYKDPHASESHIAGALAQCLGQSPK
jgi:arylsulfatase A-like enzyme